MKTCNKCKQAKSFSDFNKNKRTKDGLQRYCKSCTAKFQKNHYLAGGKEKTHQRNLEYRQRNITFTDRYKKLFGKCVDCGITDYKVLQFDHKNNKLHDVSDLRGGAGSLKVLKEEIRKCEMRCANCHQIKTHYK